MGFQNDVYIFISFQINICVCSLPIKVRENRKATTNGQSRDTNNFGFMTQDGDKQSKKHNTKKTGCEPMCSGRVIGSCFIKDTHQHLCFICR